MDTNIDFPEFNGSVSNEKLYLILQYQAKAMQKFEENFNSKTSVLNELSSSVHMLTDRLNRMDGYDRRVTTITTSLAVHKSFMALAATVITIFIPIMVTWNFQLRSELQLLHSVSDKSSEKINTLERIVYKLPEAKGN